MSSLLLDTHAWVWFAQGSRLLPPSLRRRIEAAGTVIVSSISVFEIGQKLRLGKWPGMSAAILTAMIEDAQSGIELRPLDAPLAQAASLMSWDHRDPFDRMIAATAIAQECPLVSKDDAFDRQGAVLRIWS